MADTERLAVNLLSQVGLTWVLKSLRRKELRLLVLFPLLCGIPKLLSAMPRQNRLIRWVPLSQDNIQPNDPIFAGFERGL